MLITKHFETAPSIWFSFCPIAELMSLATTLFLFIRIYRQKIAPMLQ